MTTMTFAEFQASLINGLQDYFENSTFAPTRINKSTGVSYNGIVRKGDTLAAVINADDLYRNFKNDVSFDECLARAIKVVGNKPQDFKIDPKDVSNWEKVKGHVLPRLVPANNYFMAYPHVEVANLLMLFYVVFLESDDGISSATVTTELAECWHVDATELRDMALINLENKAYTLDDFMGMLTFLTSTNKHRGAVEILNPRAMAQAREKLGEFYILPSSQHEVILVPKSMGSVTDLAELVKSVNGESVKDEDKLSDNVYEYNFEEGTIIVAG